MRQVARCPALADAYTLEDAILKFKPKQTHFSNSSNLIFSLPFITLYNHFTQIPSSPRRRRRRHRRRLPSMVSHNGVVIWVHGGRRWRRRNGVCKTSWIYRFLQGNSILLAFLYFGPGISTWFSGLVTFKWLFSFYFFLNNVFSSVFNYRTFWSLIFSVFWTLIIIFLAWLIIGGKLKDWDLGVEGFDLSFFARSAFFVLIYFYLKW